MKKGANSGAGRPQATPHAGPTRRAPAADQPEPDREPAAAGALPPRIGRVGGGNTPLRERASRA